MQCEVPTYLRALLELKGFNNVVSVKEMDDDDIAELETFVQSECIKKNADLANYCGNYCNDIKSFEISRGTRKMLKQISNYCREKYSSVGPHFFYAFDATNRTFLKTMKSVSECLNRNDTLNGTNFTLIK